MQSPEDVYTLLRAAISDGGVAARNQVETEARTSDELEITFLAYAALATWERKGLGLIVSLAVDGYTVKSKSAALTLLTMLATSGQIAARGMLVDPSFITFVNGKIDIEATKPAARQALRQLVVSLPIDDLLIPLSQSFMHLAMQAPELAQELVASISTKWLRFGSPTLNSYEQMLLESANDEPSFQAFFCTFPQLLDPMAIEVWSQPYFHGALYPDFVIRRADNSYLVVEIECPGKMLLTKSGQLSQEAIHAEKQALDYESFLSERIAEARLHFPNYRRADCLVVVGLERGLMPGQHQDLDRVNARRQDLKIVGFDWLLERAKTVISNISEGRIKVTQRYRVI